MVIDKKVDAVGAVDEQRADAVARIVAGVFVLIYVLGLVRSLW